MMTSVYVIIYHNIRICISIYIHAVNNYKSYSIHRFYYNTKLDQINRIISRMII